MDYKILLRSSKLLQMVILHKTDSTQFLEKNLASFFARQTVPKSRTDTQGIQNSQSNLEKEHSWRSPFLILKLTIKLSQSRLCIDISAYTVVRVHAKSLQLCLTLCYPMNYSLPGSSVHGILQARILQWVTMASSREASQHRDRTYVSYVSRNARQTFYHQYHLGSPNTD